MNLLADRLPPNNPAGDDVGSRRLSHETESLTLADISGGGGLASVDFRELWSAIYRNRYLIVLVTVACLLIGLAVTLAMTQIYRAEASLQIDQQAQDVLRGDENRTTVPTQDADRFLQTQLDIIESRYLADQVARSLNLYANREFLEAMKSPASDEVWANRDERREAVLDTLSDNLEASLPMESRIAKIAFYSPDPQLAARVANSFASNAIDANLRRKVEQSSYARDYLERQLSETQQRLEESERELVDYARDAGIIDTSAGANTGRNDAARISGGGSINTATLIELNSALARATAEKIEAESRWREASTASALTLPQALNNQAVQELLQARAVAQAQYEEQLESRRADHPEVKQLAARVEQLTQDLGAVASRVRAAVKHDYDAALRRERALAQRVESLKGRNLAEQDLSVRYNILRRNADANRGMYESLLQRYREVSAEAGVTSSNITLLDRADVPLRPVLPRPVLNLGLAAFVGIMLSLLLVFIRERLDDVIRSPIDIEDKLGLHALGAIPLSEDPISDLDDPKSEVSEAFHTIRTSLELASSGGIPRSIMFTSSQPSEGKSTTSVAVARSLSLVGKKVILLDADLRRPNLHRLVDLKNSRGLSDLLAGRQPLDAVVHRGILNGVDVVTAGPVPPSPTELLDGEQWGTLLASLNERYDVTIFDCPPVMGLADAPLLSAKIGATIFVIEANKAHRGRAKIALRRLGDAQGHIIGGVLTKFDARSLGYKGYEAYGYSYVYGQQQ